MYGLAPIGYLSGAGLKVTGSSWAGGGGGGTSLSDFNGIRGLWAPGVWTGLTVTVPAQSSYPC